MFELELSIAEGGTSYIDDEMHAVSENTVICAQPGQMRHTKFPFKCYYIHMILGEGQLFDVLTTLPNYLEPTDAKEIKEIFIALCEHYNTGASDEDILLQSLILRLIYTLKRCAPSAMSKHAPKSNNHKAIEQVLSYIKNNLTAELTLEKMAEKANFSTIYFHKLFKASTGKTLHEYVEEQRIKKAILLLTSTDMTLTEIAYECGFSSQSYFSMAFKRKMHQTPRAYMKEISNRYFT